YKLDIRQSKIELVRRNLAPVSFWDATEAGTIVLGTGLRNMDLVAFVRDGHGFSERPIPNLVPDAPLPGIVAISDERTGFVAVDRGDGRAALYEIDLQTLGIGTTVFADPDFDVYGGLIRDPQTRKPIAVAYHRDLLTLKWLDANWQARADELAKA